MWLLLGDLCSAYSNGGLRILLTMVSLLRKWSPLTSGTNIFTFYLGKFKTSTKLDRIKHGLANFVSQTKSGLPPVFIKFYWNAAMFTHRPWLLPHYKSRAGELQPRLESWKPEILLSGSLTKSVQAADLMNPIYPSRSWSDSQYTRGVYEQASFSKSPIVPLKRHSMIYTT